MGNKLTYEKISELLGMDKGQVYRLGIPSGDAAEAARAIRALAEKRESEAQAKMNQSLKYRAVAAQLAGE